MAAEREEAVVEAEGPVEAAGLVVAAEARGSAAREFPGTRLRHLWMPHARPRTTDKGRPTLTSPN